MRDKSVLVTGANGDIAAGIGRILALERPEFRRIGVEVAGTGEWPARDVFHEVRHLPRGDAAAYTNELRSLIAELDPYLVVPSTEPELRAISVAPGALEGLPLLLNPSSIIQCFLDKLQTNVWLRSVDLEVPRTSSLHDAHGLDLPVIVKPREGRGSRGVEVVRTQRHLEFLQESRSDDFLAQEYIDADDAEFTCCILRLDAEDIRTLIMRRALVGGMTARVRVEEDDAIENVLQRIAANLPDGSNINVQLRVGPNGPRVFEVNPRISGTVMMRHRLGFRDVLWWMAAREGIRLPAFRPPAGATVFRTYGEAVVLPG